MSDEADRRHERPPTPGRDGEAATGADDFAVVYRRHVGFVARVARQLGADDDALEDVVHDTFLVVHRRLADFDPSSSMRSWLYGITRRVVLHHRRRRARASRRERQFSPPTSAELPDAALAREQAASLVEEFLQSLDRGKRMVFVLSEVEGCSGPEIAEAMGIKLNTVYSRLRLARRRFEAFVARTKGER